MEPRLELIRHQQKESWNKFSPGWKKWDSMFMEFLKPMGDEIISMLNLRGNEIVLDVASGTGEPGLTIASLLNKGKVVMTDLSEDMLAISVEQAMNKDIKNVEAWLCDVCELPFTNSRFDAVSCRFGFMFFPDMSLAAQEIVRVLKPGGRIATSVWNVPEKNFWITAIINAIKMNMPVPPVPPGAPGMFRCAREGVVSDLFLQTGLRNVTVKEVRSKLNCKTADIYWTVMNEVAAPVVAALDGVDNIIKERIRNEVFRTIHEKYTEGNVCIEASAYVIYGQK